MMMDEKQSMDFTKIFANLPLPSPKKNDLPKLEAFLF